ncbi:MAG TPA: hypothetical protein VJC13_03365 [Candidatus Paceibacterota bacterium]
MDGKRGSSSVLVWSVVVIVVVAGVYGIFRYTQKSSKSVAQVPIDTSLDTATQTPPIENTATQTLPVVPPVTPPKPKPTTFVYKNATYSADGNYFSPGGSEQIAVSVTIKDDVVTAASVNANAPSGPTAAKYQSIFVDNFKQYVVGKKIDEINLTKVSGSSLTPKGFNDALAKIKVEAKA